jgi:DNA-binding CsgD family transcriptional regulator
MDKVYDHGQYFLSAHSGFYAILAGGLLLAHVAMWRGDVELWKKARQHILEAPCKDDRDRDIVALSLASADSTIRNTYDFPEWFKRGSFNALPADAHPAARVYYVKYLLIVAQNPAMNRQEDSDAFGLMKAIPYITEPMISQACVEKTVLSEIYLRLLCAIAYYDTGEIKRAAEHIDRAIELALPDGLIGVLAEHRRHLGSFLDDRVALASPEALKRLKELYKQLSDGWTKLHNAVLERRVSAELSQREREVARLVAFGLSNAEIAERLSISRESVKSLITTIRNKTGIVKRAEFSDYV